MMKTSEDDKKFLSELFQEYADLVDGKGIQRAHHMLAQYKLDAFKAGAEWAAKLCEDQTFAAGGKRDLNEISYDTACIDCQKIIQEEASNLKEIPK